MGCGGSKKPKEETKKSEEKHEENKHDITSGYQEIEKPSQQHETKTTEEGQAGGHAGTLIFEGNKLLKKAKKGEIDFFQYLYSPDQADQDIIELRKFAPGFYGIEERNNERYISMENLLTGYEHPNIMDCKLGRITWTPHHTEETKAHQEAKNKTTTTGSLGFRISGIVTKDSNGKKIEAWAKKEGFFGINEGNIHEQFVKIVTHDGKINHEAIDIFIKGTIEILDWFKRQKARHFVASSVFYVSGKNNKHQVRYIDFAHAIEANGEIDQNVIEGLENCIKIWEKVKNPIPQPVASGDQAGGHEGSLIFRGNKLLKKAHPAEIGFYSALFDPQLENSELIEFRKFVPYFYGVEIINNKNYIVLENVLFGYEHPNVLDCKIGKVTWTKDHNEVKTKKQQEKAKTTTTGSLGFRISGLITKDEHGNKIESWSKDGGYFNITPENIHEQLVKIVSRGETIQIDRVELLMKQTQEILNWFIRQRSKLFFTASVLYVNGIDKAQARFIDFAHVFDSEDHEDTNTIEGLQSLISCWQEVIRKYTPPQERVKSQSFPYEVTLEEGKTYHYCDCGRSKSQPFCDGSHADTTFTPIAVVVNETKNYHLCGCKSTKNKPYCDGTHQKLDW